MDTGVIGFTRRFADGGKGARWRGGVCVCAFVRWFVVLLAMRAGSAGRLYYGLDNVGVRVSYGFLYAGAAPRTPNPRARHRFGGAQLWHRKWQPVRGGIFYRL